MAHPKATTAPPANNGKRRRNRRQSMPASGETTAISTCRGMKARVGNLVRKLEAAQRRLDQNPQAMRVRRETLEHPFGTMKARMGATHFLTKTLPKVVTEMALSVLAYNLTGVMNIIGTRALMAAIEA